MALFNEVLVGRYNSILHKLLNMKEGAPAPTLATDLTAGICLECDRPEWQFLGGEWRGALFAAKAADVANLSYVGIFNGQQTGVLGIIESLMIVNVAAAAVTYRILLGGTTGLTGTARGFATDLRWTKSSALLVGSGIEAAVTGNQILQATVPGGNSLVLPLNVVLPPFTPGLPITNVTVEPNVINQAVFVGFTWREHAMEPSESR